MCDIEAARNLVYDCSDYKLLPFLYGKDKVVGEYIKHHRPQLAAVVDFFRNNDWSAVVSFMSGITTRNFFENTPKIGFDFGTICGLLSDRNNRQSEDLRFVYMSCLWLSSTQDGLAGELEHLVRDKLPFIQHNTKNTSMIALDDINRSRMHDLLVVNPTGRVWGQLGYWQEYIKEEPPLHRSADSNDMTLDTFLSFCKHCLITPPEEI